MKPTAGAPQLVLGPEDPRWDIFAACSTADAEAFFPQGNAKGTVTRAKAVCMKCPVFNYCLAEIERDPARAGVWAATTKADRREWPRPQSSNP